MKIIKLPRVLTVKEGIVVVNHPNKQKLFWKKLLKYKKAPWK